MLFLGVQTMSPTDQNLQAVDCCDYHAVPVVENSCSPQRFPPQGFRPGKLHPLLKATRRGLGQRLNQS